MHLLDKMRPQPPVKMRPEDAPNRPLTEPTWTVLPLQPTYYQRGYADGYNGEGHRRDGTDYSRGFRAGRARARREGR